MSRLRAVARHVIINIMPPSSPGRGTSVEVMGSGESIPAEQCDKMGISILCSGYDDLVPMCEVIHQELNVIDHFSSPGVCVCLSVSR